MPSLFQMKAWQLALAVVFFGWLGARCGHCQAPQGQQPEFEVQEASLWLADGVFPQLNDTSLGRKDLPLYADTLRLPKHDEFQLGPMSVVYFFGQPATGIDLEVRTRGQFLSHWPGAEFKHRRIRWLGIDLAADPPARPRMAPLPAGHWMNSARAVHGLYAVQPTRTERFLAYDPVLPAAIRLTITGEPDLYTLSNASPLTLMDVCLVLPTPEGYRFGWMAEIPAATARSKQPKITQSFLNFILRGGGKTAENRALEDVFEEGTPSESTQETPAPAAPQPEAAPPQSLPEEEALADDMPAEDDMQNAGVALPMQPEPVPAQPGDLPADDTADDAAAEEITTGEYSEKTETIEYIPASVQIKMSPPCALGSAEFKAQWNEGWMTRLKAAGLQEGPAKALVARAESGLLASQRLVAVYRLPQAWIQEALPMEVYPDPTKIVRVSLVLHGRLDPGISKEVERYIAQLHDDSFEKREQAEAELKKLGRFALEALRGLLENQDPEVAYRAERILAETGLLSEATVGSATNEELDEEE